MHESKTELKQQAREAFLDFFERRGVAAPSLELLATQAGMSVAELEASYTSIDILEQDVWLGLLETTLSRLNSSSEYQESPARKKALAFYFAFLEVLEPHRTYARTVWENASFLRYIAPFLDTLRKGFDQYIIELLKLASDSEEIPNRPIIDQFYPEIFWIQFIYVLNFWLNDKSPQAFQTDAAVEKAVRLSFDLIGKSPLDSLIDFGNVFMQNPDTGKNT